MEMLVEHLSEIVSFLVGAAAGSLVSISWQSRKTAGKGMVDQAGAKAGGDVVGRDKTTLGKP